MRTLYERYRGCYGSGEEGRSERQREERHCGGRGEFGLHGKQDVLDILDVNYVAVGIEHLDEAAHVRPLKFFGQVDEHTDSRDCVLDAPLLIPHGDGESQAPYPDFVDAQFAIIPLTLFVVQRRGSPAVSYSSRRTTLSARAR